MTNEAEDKRFERLSRDRFARPMPKRFYKEVSISASMEILLDSRPVRTPLKAPLVVPNPHLAGAVADEWRVQGEFIDLLKMPFTKLSNTAIDRMPRERQVLIDEIVAFANSDLVCYRATEPAELVGRQSALWDPVLLWAYTAMGASFRAVSGIGHIEQSSEALAACRRKIDGFDDFYLVALQALVTLSGSALLGLMLASGGLKPEAAWAAANLDERWQIEQWGEDHEAKFRNEARWAEFSAAARFLNLAAMSA